jgi:hypothetical protein
MLAWDVFEITAPCVRPGALGYAGMTVAGERSHLAIIAPVHDTYTPCTAPDDQHFTDP